MRLTPINAPTAPQPDGGYAQALKAENVAEFLFVSGQIPVDPAGVVPVDFDSQCRLVWSNIMAQLAAANMKASDIVKVTTFLSDRVHAERNGAIRREVLGEHKPALTVVLAGIYDPLWMLEIEAIAARGSA
jgi:2-iminobutanoate/2-iminopropanoate deaminase